MKRLWTQEEDDYIINNYKNMTWKDMAIFLNCSIETVQKRARDIGLEFEHKNVARWTEEEVKLLREYSKKYVTKNVAKKLNKSIIAVQKRAIKEGIILHGSNDPWKPWMINYLKDNINSESIRQIAIFIGISEFRVRSKCKELNLDYNNNRWTEEETNILLKNYDKCHYSELTKLLPNKSKSAINCKARSMNLKIITEITQYNEEHAKFIKDNWNNLTINELSRQLKITIHSVYKYKKLLNLPNKGQRIKWDNNSLSKLEELARSMSIKELSDYFKTTTTAIITISSRNNIKLIDSKVKWTEEKINEIRELAQNHNITEICSIIGCNYQSIKRIIDRNNIVCVPQNYKNKWTDEEIDLLVLLTNNNCDIPTIMKKIDKTDNSIVSKCKELNLQYIQFNKKEWSKDEINNLIEDAKKLSINELVIKYNRSSMAIRSKLVKNNSKTKSLIDYWNEDENDLLKKLVCENKDLNFIAKKLNRTVSAVENKIRREKLEYKNNKLWTKQEEELLENLWDEHNYKYISKKLNRSISSIKNKAYKMGLCKQFLHQDSIKIEEISELFNVRRNDVETTWIILGLPYNIEYISKYSSYKYVKIDDLFNFLEKNQFLYDGRDFEENILGKEPDWVKEKRKHDTFYGFDYNRTSLIKKKLLQQKKYYLELEKEKINEKKLLKK